MLKIQYALPPPTCRGGTASCVRSSSSADDCALYLVGSKDNTQSAINSLHTLG